MQKIMKGEAMVIFCQKWKQIPQYLWMTSPVLSSKQTTFFKIKLDSVAVGNIFKT